MFTCFRRRPAANRPDAFSPLSTEAVRFPPTPAAPPAPARRLAADPAIRAIARHSARGRLAAWIPHGATSASRLAYAFGDGVASGCGCLRLRPAWPTKHFLASAVLLCYRRISDGMSRSRFPRLVSFPPPLRKHTQTFALRRGKNKYRSFAATAATAAAVCSRRPSSTSPSTRTPQPDHGLALRRPLAGTDQPPDPALPSHFRWHELVPFSPPGFVPASPAQAHANPRAEA